jgi:hypothetical protein
MNPEKEKPVLTLHDKNGETTVRFFQIDGRLLDGRLPVNACPGCNAGKPISRKGVHFLGAGQYLICPFIKREVETMNLKNWEVHRTHRGANNRASRIIGGFLRVSGGPVGYWISAL